jgi:hypothetical protein
MCGLQTDILPDIAYLAGKGVDYLPCLWPGFSWSNMHGGTTPLNQIPRQSGRFLWHQLDNALSVAKVNMMFGAMFDEVDEGTAMVRAAEIRCWGEGRSVHAHKCVSACARTDENCADD